MLVTSAPLAENTGLSGVDAVHAEFSHEPGFLGRGIVVAARHRAGMAHRAGQLDFQRPTTQATTGLVQSASRS